MERRLKKTAEKEELLNRFLKQEMQLSEHQIRRAKFRPGGICVNGKTQRVTTVLQRGDQVEVVVEGTEKTSEHILPTPGCIEVLYEDQDLLAVNKPAGLALHPAHGHYQDTLVNQVQYYLQQKGENLCIRPVGRLDLDTSGLVLFAKNQITAARMSAGRLQKDYRKTYLAVLKTIPKKLEGTITFSIAPDPDRLGRMCVSDQGRPAITHYRVIRQTKAYAVAAVTLETGRTHQIRLHMASIGCPLWGDPLYGQQDVISGGSGPENLGGQQLCRTALHAWICTLIHPMTGEKLQLTAPIPEDLQRFCCISENNLSFTH